MEVKNDGKHDGYYTARQWAKQGYLPSDGAAGTRLWTNYFCQHSCIYYTKEEVAKATPEDMTACQIVWQRCFVIPK